jgi:HK97 gp10 family phage protein
LDELRARLLELPKELQKGPLRSAVSAGAKVVQDKAKELAPLDEGTLKRSIYRTRSRSLSSAVQETHVVGVRYGRQYRRRGQDAWYWRFLEFGTSKLAARPFLRPAFDQMKVEAVMEIKNKLALAIERSVLKLRAK